MPSTDTPSPPRQPQQLPPLALLVYPITLFMGSLYSAISPTARRDPSSPSHDHPAPLTPSIATDIHHSYSPAESPVNYFARKDNIFNVWFVKIGWVWFSLAFAVLVFVSRTARSSSSAQGQGRRTAQAVIRYTLATSVWYLMTQWFFGPAVIDRSFVITGGKCQHLAATGDTGDAGGGAGASSSSKLETVLTAAACKAAGGAWTGGHDISGHVFMLVLATAILGVEGMGVFGWEKLVGVLTCGSGSSAEADKEKKDGHDTTATAADGEGSGLQVWALRFVIAVAGMGWWMLFMTAIWFHTLLEKWSGLAIALGTVYVIYFLPRKVPAWRDFVGIPGV